jgi:DNA-binding transcriptional LysR family regulator
LKELQEGELTISTSDTTALYILPDVLQDFRKQYPGVEVQIYCKPSPVAAEQVLAREADLGIVTLPIEHPRLSSEALIVRRDVAICAPGHPLAKRKRIAFTELAEYPLLLLDIGSNTRAYIDQRFQTAGLTPKIAMELGSIEVIKKLVQLDFGVSIVPRIALHDELEQGSIQSIDLFRKEECRTLGVIYPSKGISSLSAQIFITMLKKHLSTQDTL